MKSLLEALLAFASAFTILYVFHVMGANEVQAKGIQPDGSSIHYRLWQEDVERECFNISIVAAKKAWERGDFTEEEALWFSDVIKWKCLLDSGLAF